MAAISHKSKSISIFSDLAGHIDNGQMAARNPCKALNHIQLVRQNELVANMLGINGCASPQRTPPHDQDILVRHFEEQVSTSTAVRRLASNGQNNGTIAKALQSVYTSAQVEFHPCDVCNEACPGCTYGHDDPTLKPPPINFPFDQLQKLASFQPSAMVITGGGEPLLYRDRRSGKKFTALMHHLRRLLPSCQFGLISNGTLYPDGDWPDLFRWIRISVDAGNGETYFRQRGRPFFERVSSHVLRLFGESSVPRIGVGFVYSNGNIEDAVGAARYFYDLIRTKCPANLPRLNIQYRPLRRDRGYAGREFPAAISKDQINNVELQLIQESSRNPGFHRFLVEQTNCEVISGGNVHPQVDFSHCYYSSIFRLIRANGSIYPCCMRIAEPEFLLGNVLNDSKARIALNILNNVYNLKSGCDAQGCKLCHVNSALESGISDSGATELTPDLKSDPFFG